MISVLQLGTLDYPTGLRLQQKLVELRKENRISDVLLLLEHTPVITLGRNAQTANIVASQEQLSRRGVEIHECDRGGDVTFHGPGQLVGYPIFDLRAFPSADSKRKTLGVIEYVRRIEEVLIATCADFGIATQRVCGLTGVWTREVSEGKDAVEVGSTSTGAHAHAQTSEQAKIAAIGVHVSRSVTSHGFALNVESDLSFFNLIIPCGIASKPVTSMTKELGRSLDASQVATSVVRNFGEVFQSQILWLDTLDSFLGETVGVPMQVPNELREIKGEPKTFWA